jgi:hypothetical protein
VRRGPLSYVLLFLALSLLYHSNLRPIASGDSLPASLIPFSILLDRSVTLDRFGSYLDEQVPYESSVIQKKAGRWYSWYPIAGPVLSAPLYVPLAVVPAVRRLPAAAMVAVARIYEKVVAAALAAAGVIAMLMLLQRIAPAAAWPLGLLFAAGTANWSTSSQALWPHTYGVPFIIGCLYAVERLSDANAEKKWCWLAGLFAGLALAIRPTNVLLLPAIVVALAFQRARAGDYVRVLILPTIAAALMASYNLSVFGNPVGGYQTRLNLNFLPGLAGILASPGRGLLVYTPVAVFALCSLSPSARQMRVKHHGCFIAAATFVVLQLAAISAWPVWWGGYCWGPRLLTEILPPLVVLIAVGLPAISGVFRAAFLAAAVYGVFIQAVGVYCYPQGHWDHTPVSVDQAPQRVWDWRDNPIGRTVQGGIAWQPYKIVAAGLRGGLPAAAQELQRLGINAY